MHGSRGLLPLVLTTLVACGGAEPNVLLVTFDTTRADHMGFARGERDVTPMLDAMAARGTWFSRVVTAQPLTLPAHASILTGLYPPRHGVRNNGTYVVPPETATLAERLRDAGYATHAVVSAFVLDSQFGLDQGFAGYDDDLSHSKPRQLFMFEEIPAEVTAGKAVRWLTEERPRDAPFFLWVHFFDPHAGYDPPSDVAERFPGDPYTGEIHYADRELGRILQALDSDGELEETLFVFTSDHGDGLGEHGERTHGMFVYESTTRVPLVLAGPGVPGGQRVDRLARTVDLVPTVLDLLGLPEEPDLDGASLRSLWEDAEAPGRVAYAETLNPLLTMGWSELRTLRSETGKVIQAPRPEAYDLARDPRETENLLAGSSPPPDLTRGLFRDLDRMVALDPFARGEQREADLSSETRRKLAALGYAMAGDHPEPSAELPDPKDRIDSWERFQLGQNLVRAERYEEAREVLEAVAAENEGNLLAMGSLAQVYRQLGDTDRALELHRRILERDPRMDASYLGAARILEERKEHDEARELLQALLERQPTHVEARVALADIDLEQGRIADAIRRLERATELDPDSRDGAAALGNALNRAGRLAEAKDVLATARRRDPDHHLLTYNLAVVLDRLGNATEALELFRVAVRLDQEHAMSWNNLGSMLYRRGDLEGGLDAVGHAYRLDPESPEACYNLAIVLLASGRPGEALRLAGELEAVGGDPVWVANVRAQAFERMGLWARAADSLRAVAGESPEVRRRIARLEAAAEGPEGPP